LISVVVPTLNAGKYLGPTLESILCQDFKDMELILVDSNSVNGTLRIIKEYKAKFGDRLRLQRTEREGQVAAINHGLRVSTGDIIAFINSDDVYEMGCFARVDQLFATKQALQWCYGIGKVVDSEGRFARSLVTRFKGLWWIKNSYRVLSWFDYIVQPTVFWKRSLLEKVGYFNSQYPLCFDYDYWLRCWKVAKPEFIDAHLANWRAHKDAISVRNTNAQIDESLRINMSYAQGSFDLAIQNLVAWGEKLVYGLMK
jgi:glycosyltransferase involved in cell wall biosynthesis